MTRPAFQMVLWAAWALAGVAWAGRSQCDDGPIAIVGSGIAGLVAARSLVEFGCNVTVFEAQNYMGGRTHTLSSGLFAGIEEGAHWVHGGSQNLPSSTMLDFLGVKQVRVGGDSDYEGDRNLLKIFPAESAEPLSPEQRDASFDLFQTAQAAALNYATAEWSQKEAVGKSAAEAWTDALDGINYTKQDRLLLSWHQRVVYEQDSGSSLESLNAAAEWFDDYTDFYRPGPSGGWEKMGDGFVVDGYSAVVQRLAEGLDVRLNSPVEVIAHAEESSVVLRVGGERFQAAAAVVTASVGALQAGRPRFEPALTGRKATALQRLRMGNVAKVLVRLSEGVNMSRLGAYTTGRLAVADEIVTYCINDGYQRSRVRSRGPSDQSPHTLECFLGGRAALTAESLSDEELRARVARELSSILGTDAGVENATVTRWSSNPYVLGAWSYMPVGAKAHDHDALAEAEGDGRVHFAGEATCRLLYGNVHAAVVSGARAALEILGLDAAGAPAGRWPFFRGQLPRLCTEAPVPAAGLELFV